MCVKGHRKEPSDIFCKTCKREEEASKFVLTVTKESLEGSRLWVSCTDLGGTNVMVQQIDSSARLTQLRRTVATQLLKEKKIEFESQLELVIGEKVSTAKDILIDC